VAAAAAAPACHSAGVPATGTATLPDVGLDSESEGRRTRTGPAIRTRWNHDNLNECCI
jgi:hypothetical protein